MIKSNYPERTGKHFVCYCNQQIPGTSDYNIAQTALRSIDTSGLQKGATYPEIKARVLEQTGLKVSSLYISQIKQKCGLEVRESHHKAKSENAKQPHCPPEKEAAIRNALKYFKMI